MFASLFKSAWLVGGMAVALLAVGLLLKSSYEANGRLSTEVEIWQAALADWQESYAHQQKELEAAQQRLQRRELAYQQIQGKVYDYQNQLRAIVNDSPDDRCGVRPDIWMLIKDSAAGSSPAKMSGD